MSMAIESDKAMTRKPRRFLSTKTADERGFATRQPSRAHDENGLGDWDTVFNKLAEWGKTPSKIDEDGLESPSFEAISRTIEIIGVCHGWNKPAPTAIVPDGEGGIALDWSNGEELESIRIEEDGVAECLNFSGTRLVGRFSLLPLPG
jgi:hypothetical protein